MTPTFKPIADHALLVTFAEEISEEAHEMIVALDREISVSRPMGIIETVPALVNLLVSFDPMQTDPIRVRADVSECLAKMKTAEIKGSKRVVQVCYEAPFAPDLDEVARLANLSTDAVIAAHLAGDYRALMYGFAPGYAYLSGVQEEIQIPRKTKPVRDVPQGSVIIAGPQCLVTTLTMPTGWCRIGRSPTKIQTGDVDKPFLFEIGDRIEFARVSIDEFHRLHETVT